MQLACIAMHSCTVLWTFVFVVVRPSSCQTVDKHVNNAAGGSSSYVAAVYEHRVILNPEPGAHASREAALEHMWKNLDIYEEQAARAAQQGVQILVFPEDGIQGFNYSRSSISGYLETVPNPQLESWNPCTQPEKYRRTEVLQRLSCMARRNSLYLVANMAGVQPCGPSPDPTSPSPCPSDGRWQFNTDVVFRSDGVLVARYHKHNLYFENAFDKPPSLEVVTFDTPFAGKFGVLTCFDLMFHDPTVTLLEKGVRQLVYPTAWMNQLPLLAAAQFQRAVSLGAGVSILGANIRSDALGMTGSGIFSPESVPLHHHARRGEPEEGKLLVARVPVLDPLWTGDRRGAAVHVEEKEALDSGYCLQEDGCQTFASPRAPPPTVTPSFQATSSDTFTASMMYDPFTFAPLRGSAGELTVCDGPFCCHLQYRRSSEGGSTELYALGAFAGTHTVNGRYALQVCALVRCAGTQASSCGQEVDEAESKMDFVLEGAFDTRHVYPSVLASGVVFEQPKQVARTSGGMVTMKHSNMTAGLVTACLYGRMYHLDED